MLAPAAPVAPFARIALHLRSAIGFDGLLAGWRWAHRRLYSVSLLNLINFVLSSNSAGLWICQMTNANGSTTGKYVLIHVFMFVYCVASYTALNGCIFGSRKFFVFLPYKPFDYYARVHPRLQSHIPTPSPHGKVIFRKTLN